MIKVITRDICKLNQLKLSVMIFLTSSDYTTKQYKPRKSFKKFIGQGGVSLTYDLPTFVVLDYTMCTGTFNKEHKIFVPLQQLARLIKFVNKTVKVVEDPNNNIYYWDADHNNRLSMYVIHKEDLEKITNTLYSIAGGHIIRSIPTIVHDYQENLYEGATIYFDRTEISVNLTYDELYTLQYILYRTDFVTLGQEMLNSTNIWTDKMITKHLDIETTTSSDIRQRRDLNNGTIEQPTSNYGGSVFNELIKE